MSAAVLKFVPNDAIAPNNDAIAESLVNLATMVRDGLFGNLNTVLCVIEPVIDPLTYQVYGQPLDRARAIGLLTMLAVRHTNA